MKTRTNLKAGSEQRLEECAGFAKPLVLYRVSKLPPVDRGRPVAGE